jgi:hypothetical protein
VVRFVPFALTTDVISKPLPSIVIVVAEDPSATLFGLMSFNVGPGTDEFTRKQQNALLDPTVVVSVISRAPSAAVDPGDIVTSALVGDKVPETALTLLPLIVTVRVPRFRFMPLIVTGWDVPAVAAAGVMDVTTGQ